MLRDQDIQLATPVVKEQFHLRTDHKVGLQSIPLYELDATAGLVELFSDQAPIFRHAMELFTCEGIRCIHY